MARNRKVLGQEIDAQVVALMQGGGTARTIARTLKAKGADVSQATIGRRMRELRGDANADRAQKVRDLPPVEPPLPEGPDQIPADADERTLARWLETAAKMGKVAAAEGDLDGFGKMARLSGSLLDLKRKSAPLPKSDPNDDPDLNAARERARARFHKLIDQVLTP